MDADKRYQRLLEHISEAFLECGLDGNIIRSNSSFKWLFGLDPDSSNGKNIKELISEKNASELFSAFDRSLRTGIREIITAWEISLTCGRNITAEVILEPILDGKGQPDGFDLLIRDLSETELMVEALKESEEKYRYLVESANDFIYLNDWMGNFRFMNSGGLKRLGYSMPELAQLNYLDIIPQDYREKEFNYYRDQLLNHIEETYHELPVQTKTGEILWIGQTVRAVQRQTGEVQFYCVARDITEFRRMQEALRQSEEKYRTIIDSLKEGYYEVDIQGNITFINRAMTQIFGYPLDSLLGHNYREIMTEESVEKIFNTFRRVFVTGERGELIDWEMIHKDGTRRNVEASVDLIHDSAGKPCGFRGILRDITDRKRAEAALPENERKYRELVDNLPEIVFELDSSGNLTYCNRRVTELMGYTLEEMIGKSALDLVESADRDRALRGLNNTLSGYSYSGKEYTFKGKERDIPVILYTNPIIENGVTTGMRGIAVDITKVIEAEQQVYRLTFYDTLTSLPNRDLFKNKLQTEIMKSQRFAVMSIGLDKFKGINDMYGNTVGDKLLQEVAERLKNVYFKKDMVSRFDGDKFMLLLASIGDTSDSINVDDIDKIVNKTRRIFSNLFRIDNNEIEITPSIGVCVYPDDGKDAEDLIKNAETAMFMAKSGGRNTSRYYDAILNEEMMNRLKLEKDMKSAIVNDEFAAYYQPKVDRDGRIIGMESLIRWISPSRNRIIPPIEFIPIAEKNGLIVEIGYHILEKSCLQNREWQNRGYPNVRVAVNLSPYQFRQPDLIESIKKIVLSTGIDPQWLELEITESGIMDNENDSVRKLSEISAMGIGISIDDFGTGYSSLSKLRTYPIDTLKIDKSFVDDLPGDPTAVTITKTIIDLAHNLGCRVVAEGVETKEQLDFLVENHCEFFQGYYFYKPMPSADFEMKLKG